MNNDRIQTISTLLVTVALLLFCYLLILKALDLAAASDRVSPETLVVGIMGFANLILVAVVARWLQQGAQQSAEKTAAKLQEAVASATNGTTTQVKHMDVDAETATIAEAPK